MRVRCDPRRPYKYAESGSWVPRTSAFLPGGSSPELDEGGQLGDLAVQGLRPHVGVLRMPIHPLGTLIVGSPVHGFDQGTADAHAAASRVDEQVFQVAVADPGPGRGMDVKVHDADDALLPIQGGQTLEGMGRIEQPAPGQVGDIGRQGVPVEVEIALPQLAPALAIVGAQRADAVCLAAIDPSCRSDFSPTRSRA